MPDKSERADVSRIRGMVNSRGKERVGGRESLKSRIHRKDRILSWLLFIVTLLTVFSGYFQTRVESQPVPVVFHVFVAVVFIILLAYHIFVYTFVVRYNWKSGFLSVLKKRDAGIPGTILILRLSGLIILVFGFYVVLSGFDYYFVFGEPFSLSNHVVADNIFYISFSIHMAAALKLVLHRWKKSLFLQNSLSLLFLSTLLIAAFAFESGFVYSITSEPGNVVQADGVVYPVNTNLMSQSRPDIFRNGSYSMFDALVQVSGVNSLDLHYHYDPDMETHVIDSFMGSPDWWYEGYYDGGYTSIPFGEINYQRMDEYPWKEGAILRMIRVGPEETRKRYEVFRTEIERKRANGGKIIIPGVIIEGRDRIQNFGSVEVYAHNLRNDTFRDGVVTAIDAVMTLGDQAHLNYTLEWYESIGTARIVRSYFVESINNDTRYRRCGFVYECGEPGYEFFRGNHIHIPSDWRVLKSPEYLKFFWICI